MGPEKSSRPFDRDRDGFVLGSGGGVVVLESLRHAKARGARIIAEVGGFNKAMCGDSQTNLNVEKLARPIAMTLRDPITGIMQKPDVIFAHATATEQDRREAEAYYKVLGRLMQGAVLSLH